MNPEFLKYLQQITSALRSGITLGGDPLGELQKRASQIGEGFGLQMEKNRAQAGYARSHPESQRAQAEALSNAAMLALQFGKPALAAEDFAAIKVGRKMYRGPDHWTATQKAIADGALPGFYEPGFDASKIKEGFALDNGKFVSREEGYKLAEPKLSRSVKAQIATRAQQGEKQKSLTAEDLKGKLYANRGTKADEPMTLDDLNRIMAKKNKRAALDSIPEYIVGAAVRSPDGRTASAPNHTLAMEAFVKQHGPISPKLEAQMLNDDNARGFLTSTGKFVDTDAAEQIGTQAMQLASRGIDASGVTAEDFKRGYTTSTGRFVNHDEAYKIADANDQINSEGRAYSEKYNDHSLESGMLKNRASLDSAVVHPLADLVRKEGKVGHLGDNDVVIDFRGKKYYGSDGQTSAYQDALSKIPHELPGPKRTMLKPGEPVPPFWGTRLHGQLTKDGGFTIDPNTGENLTSGYSVGGGEKSGVLLKKPLADLKPTEIQDFMNQNKGKLLPGQAWGGWVDNGHVYIEPADQVADRMLATKLGQQRGEKAIWDHANKTEIPTQAEEPPKASLDSAVVPAAQEFHNVLQKWHAALNDYGALGAQVHAEPNLRRSELADAHRNPYGKAPASTTRTPNTVLDESKLGPWLPEGYSADAVPTTTSKRADFSMLDKVIANFRKNYTPNVIAGLKESPKSGGWYDTSELKKAFMDESPSGEQDHAMAMQFLGPTSIGTKTRANVRQGSYMYYLWKNGLLKPEDLVNGTLKLPQGYANRRQASVNSGIKAILENGALNPSEYQKTGRYTGQAAGRHYNSGVIDMHVGRQVGEPGLLYDSRTKTTSPGVGFPTPSFAATRKVTSSPADTHYPVLENAMKSEAQRLSLPTGVYQALGWVKGGEKTGVTDARTLLELYNDAFKATGEKLGKSAVEAMRGWIRGEHPLW